MRPSLVFLCLFVGTVSSSYGQQYQVPSIYTPVQTYPPSDTHPPNQQMPSQTPALNSYFAPQAMPTPSNYFQPQPIPGQSPTLVNYYRPQPPLYPPNSLILVYYRAKAVQSSQQLAQPNEQTQENKPRVETPAGRFSTICKGEGIIAHPDSCLKFIRCKLSLRHNVYYYEERRCPRGLAFDTKLETCNYQARVPGCSKAVQSAQPTQTLLSYHGELPVEPVKEGEDSHDPSLYMMDLPQPLDDSSEEIRKQEHGLEEAHHEDSSTASIPMSGKNADGGVKSPSSPPPAETKTVKKPSNKKPQRKTVPKRPQVSGTKSAQGTKPVEQQKVETFSIGDSSESARMMVDTEENQQPAAAMANDDQSAPTDNVNHGRRESNVHYEDDDAPDEENYASTA